MRSNSKTDPSIFDDIERTLEGGAPELISQFDYLNESDRPEAARVRALMDDFLSRYPAEHRDQLRGRLRNVDDIGFQGAAFELTLHELMVRSQQRILEIEPKMPDTDRAPDFLVEALDGTKYYVEATLATGRSSADAGAQKRLDQAFKAINEVPSPNFFLSVRHSGMPEKPVSGRALKRQLLQWLDEHSYEAVSAAYDAGGFDDLPQFSYDEHGLSLKISPIPRRRTRGADDTARAIGARMGDAQWVQPQMAIRDAVASKATRYGELDRPYLIAVNALNDFAGRGSAIDALFGMPSLVITTMADGSRSEREERTKDGAWSPKRHTRVSAVLSTERLTPWSIGQARSRLIYNPWASRELMVTPIPIEAWRVRDGYLAQSPGSTIADALGLPPGWPE